MNIKGTISSVLQKGEYDQGDEAVISYDELFNLNENYEKLKKGLDTVIVGIEEEIERMRAKTGRPQLGKEFCLSRLLKLRIP